MPTSPLPSEENLSRQLQRLLQSIEAAGRAVLPLSHEELLRSIVETAARIFGAAAASIALVDEEDQVLQFVAAYGAGEDKVVGMRIPLDKGIAGCVALTGQAMAISDVQQDPNFYQDFARSTGYVPRSILATPLFSEDGVIGVMEVLDKIDASSFGLEDMELLEMFARQASLAIQQSQQVEQDRRGPGHGAGTTGQPRIDPPTLGSSPGCSARPTARWPTPRTSWPWPICSTRLARWARPSGGLAWMSWPPLRATDRRGIDDERTFGTPSLVSATCFRGHHGRAMAPVPWPS